jgi:hypothetical protein
MSMRMGLFQKLETHLRDFSTVSESDVSTGWGGGGGLCTDGWLIFPAECRV